MIDPSRISERIIEEEGLSEKDLCTTDYIHKDIRENLKHKVSDQNQEEVMNKSDVFKQTSIVFHREQYIRFMEERWI